jgi:hypothetical protein
MACPPEFPTAVLLISSPVAALVALWCKFFNATLQLIQSSQRGSSKLMALSLAAEQ